MTLGAEYSSHNSLLNLLALTLRKDHSVHNHSLSHIVNKYNIFTSSPKHSRGLLGASKATQRPHACSSYTSGSANTFILSPDHFVITENPKSACGLPHHMSRPKSIQACGKALLMALRVISMCCCSAAGLDVRT